MTGATITDTLIKTLYKSLTIAFLMVFIFIHYRHDPDDPHSLSHNLVRSIYEDSSGLIWVGTDGGEVKIVAATTSALAEHRELILASGCDELVRKPFRKHDIFDAMVRHPTNQNPIKHSEYYRNFEILN